MPLPPFQFPNSSFGPGVISGGSIGDLIGPNDPQGFYKNTVLSWAAVYHCCAVSARETFKFSDKFGKK